MSKLNNNQLEYIHNTRKRVFFAFLDRNNRTYIAICTSELNKYHASEFLEEVAKKFEQEVTDSEIEAYMHLPKGDIEFSLDPKFGSLFEECYETALSKKDELFKSEERVSNLKDEVIHQKNILIDANEELLKREERLSNIVGKAENLNDFSKGYLKTAKTVRRTFCCRNKRVLILCTILGLLFAGFVGISIYCKGFNYGECFG